MKRNELEMFINEMTYCLQNPKEFAKGYEKEIFWKYKFTLEKLAKQKYYVIYCLNNYHNLYMDYLGKPTSYEFKTVFDNLGEAHKFLREKGKDDMYYWDIFELSEIKDEWKVRN